MDRGSIINSYVLCNGKKVNAVYTVRFKSRQEAAMAKRAGTRYVASNFKTTVNLKKFSLGGENMIGVGKGSAKVEVNVMNFGNKGNTVLFTLTVTEGDKSLVLNYSWSGPDVHLLPEYKSGSPYLAVVRDNEQTLCGAVGKDAEGRWTMVVFAEEECNTMSFLKKGMPVRDVQAEWAKGGMSNFKFTRNSGNYKVYTLYGLQNVKRYNSTRTDYKVALRNNGEYGEFYFDAQGNLVKWIIF